MDDLYNRIYADPEFQQVQRRRSRFSWTLAAIMFGSYFTFILVIAFAPDLFAIPLGPDTVITWGIPLGVSIIVLGFILTGIYVYRANGEFDRSIAAIVRRLSADT
jgi:uncharacterized membrane protein (DUF485 family)